jgi:hypothetical protein
MVLLCLRVGKNLTFLALIETGGAFDASLFGFGDTRGSKKKTHVFRFFGGDGCAICWCVSKDTQRSGKRLFVESTILASSISIATECHADRFPFIVL